MKLYWPLIPLLFFIALAVFFWRGLSLEPQHLPSVLIGKTIPPFQLPDLNDEHTLFTSNLLQGKTTLLNVWASWCAACSEEQVFLLQLARQGVPLYGLNYKDNPKDATRWLAEWGNPYKRTGNDLNGKVAIELGVYGTPETFLIDAQGVIQYRHAGPLNDEVWTREFLPRIKALEKTA